jgi:hypothetical protein
VQWLPAPSKASHVDYYGCADCDDAWSVSKENSHGLHAVIRQQEPDPECVRVDQLILQVQEHRDYLCEQLKKLEHNIARAKLLVGRAARL